MFTKEYLNIEKPALTKNHSRLWLAVRLPYLPLEVYACAYDAAQPTIITAKQRVVCANQSALDQGVCLGMSQSSAQAFAACSLFQREEKLEAQLLAGLAEHCYQFTPYIETYQPTQTGAAGLLLELSRCITLFKGLANLYRQLSSNLRAHYPTYTLHYGLAHTAPGAWLLSHADNTGAEKFINAPNFHSPSALPPAQFFIQQLQQLPVQLLQGHPQAVESLEKTGFETLGDVFAQIDQQALAPLRKRFGNDFSQYLNEIFGIENQVQQSQLFTKPRPTYQPEEYFKRHMQFDHPIANLELLKLPLADLLQKLAHYLTQRQQHSQSICWRLYDIYQQKQEIIVNCSNGNSPQLLLELSIIQLETTRLPFAVDTLELECRHSNPSQANNRALAFSGNKPRNDDELAITLAKLKARLGDGAIYKVDYQAHHLPEHSCTQLPLNQTSNQPLSLPLATRPCWLFAVPEPIRHNHRQLSWRGKLELLQGPERIEGYWWQQPTARDYFIAQREDNLRLWIFFDRYNNQWYAHGVF